jgi:hypothetical protein
MPLTLAHFLSTCVRTMISCDALHVARPRRKPPPTPDHGYPLLEGRLMLPLTPHTIALASAGCSALATMLIQQGLRRSNFYAGFWINVTVGTVGLWAAVLLLVPRTEYHWGAVPEWH